jgi:hypothetical protein
VVQRITALGSVARRVAGRLGTTIILYLIAYAGGQSPFYTFISVKRILYEN